MQANTYDRSHLMNSQQGLRRGHTGILDPVCLFNLITAAKTVVKQANRSFDLVASLLSLIQNENKSVKSCTEQLSE